MDESLFDSNQNLSGKPVSVKQLRELRKEMDRPSNSGKFISSKYGIHQCPLPNFYT